MTPTLSAVRFGPGGDRREWCSHRHVYEDQAVACARRLNRSWRSTGDAWVVTWNGHLSTADGFVADA